MQPSVGLGGMSSSCSLQALLCADLHAKCAQFATFRKAIFLCFQVLLSFVPTIFVFFSNSPFYHRRVTFGCAWHLGGPGACPRHCVHITNTTIGYHRAAGLSSAKCAKCEKCDNAWKECGVSRSHKQDSAACGKFTDIRHPGRWFHDPSA